MTLVVLDSTFVVDHLRGLPAARERWVQLFERGDQPAATEPFALMPVRVETY